jgi:TonB family protein
MNKSTSSPIAQLSPLAISVLLHIVALNALNKIAVILPSPVGETIQPMASSPTLFVAIVPDTATMNQKAPAIVQKAVKEKIDTQVSNKNSTFHAASELTKLPVLVANEPNLVMLPSDQATYGKTLLRLSIDSHGKVSSLSIVESSMAADLERQVTKAFQRAIFRPGEIRGIPVDSSMDFMVEIGGNSDQQTIPSQ